MEFKPDNIENRIENSIPSVYFKFIKPYLDYIDRGEFFREPFRWLYTIIALLNILAPFYLLYKAIEIGVFSESFKFVFGLLLFWLVFAFNSWVSFQLWWDRKSKVSAVSTEGEDFIATPVYSHFIQTVGEWVGTTIAIMGSLGILILMIFGLGQMIPSTYFTALGLFGVIYFPLVGFLIIITSRFLAEQVRALVSVANNTRK